MAGSSVTISLALSRKTDRMFPRVCGPLASVSRVSFSVVSSPFTHVPSTLSRTESQASAVQANGAFSEYLVADAQLQVVPIPIGWSFEEAAQPSVAPLTALHCLHETLELPSPFECWIHRHASTHRSHLGGARRLSVNTPFSS